MSVVVVHLEGSFFVGFGIIIVAELFSELEGRGGAFHLLPVPIKL